MRGRLHGTIGKKVSVYVKKVEYQIVSAKEFISLFKYE